MKHITKNIVLGEDERLITKYDGSRYILNCMTLKIKAIPVTKSNAPEIDKREINYGEKLLAMAKEHVRTGKCKDMDAAIDAVCKNYPELYIKHTNKVMRRI